jgi:ribosomal protein L11 methyltransferase
MNWAEISINATEEWTEMVTDCLYQIGVSGVVIEDPSLVHKYIEEEQWDYYDRNLLEFGFEGVVIKGYLPANQELSGKVDQLKTLLIHTLGETGWRGDIPVIVVTEVNEDDWSNSWKAYYKPLKVGNKLVIRPSWEDYHPQKGELIITLDPGMAFGTGTHPSTNMCLLALEEYLKPGDSIIDVGTGSGILAISAAKLGAGNVLALDVDPVAVEVAKNNVEQNQVQDLIKVEYGDLLSAVTKQADLVLANIIAKVIIDLIPQLKNVLRPGGTFVAGGIILEREKEVVDQLNQYGYELLDLNRQGEWVCIVSRYSGV